MARVADSTIAVVLGYWLLVLRHVPKGESMSEQIGIRIDASDNVVTVVEGAGAGDEICFVTADGPRRITPVEAIPIGHKVALADVEPGEKIVKYGQTIGTASCRIEKGRHVHVHNVRSAVQGAERET